MKDGQSEHRNKDKEHIRTCGNQVQRALRC